MVISRGKGHSAVAGAAYRAGQNLKGIGQGQDGAHKLFRYSNRASVVRETFFMTPDGDAPDYLRLDDGTSPNVMRQARADLWNDVDGMEKGKTARLGRELQLGFAHELTHDEQRELVKEFVRERFTDGGKAVVRVGKRDVEVDLNFVVDVAIHNYGRAVPAIGASDDQRDKLRRLAADGYTFVERDEAEGMEAPHIRIERTRDGDVTGYRVYQPHAHVRITPRNFVDGQWEENKFASRALNGHDVCKNWRYDWPKLQNQYLECNGSDVRVTCTSEFEDQYPDIRFLPTSQKTETHAIDQRRDALEPEEKRDHEDAQTIAEMDEEFQKAHNEAIIDAFTELESDAEQPEEAERTRVGVWWHNMSQRFHSWRMEFKKQAEEWRERFELQKHRIKQVIGWHTTPDAPSHQERLETREQVETNHQETSR